MADIRKILKEALIGIYGLLKRDLSGKVIYYHDITCSKEYTEMGTSIELFKEHVDVIKMHGFKIVRHLPVNRKEVNICFDDGWSGIWDAREFLIENDIYPTIFIAVDLIGSEGHLSLNQILELQERGFIFQSHTCSHKRLTGLDNEALEYELSYSRSFLSQWLGRDVDSICYPYGSYSSQVILLSQKAGYKYFYTSIPGVYVMGKAEINRNLVQNSGRFALIGTLNGGLSIFASRARKHHVQS